MINVYIQHFVVQEVYIAYSPISEYRTCKSILRYKLKNSYCVNTSVIIMETKNMNQRAVWI